MSITKPVKNSNDYKSYLIKKIASDNKNYKYYESLVKPKKVYKRSDKVLTVV